MAKGAGNRALRVLPLGSAGDVRASIPSVEAYYADHAGDRVLGHDGDNAAVVLRRRNQEHPHRAQDPSSYCVDSTVGQAQYKKGGPTADITSGLY